LTPKINKIGLTFVAIHTIVISITVYSVFFVWQRSIYDGNILAFGILVIYDTPFVSPAIFLLSNLMPNQLNAAFVPTLVYLCFVLGGLQWYLMGVFITFIAKSIKHKIQINRLRG
jgi:hypothetical protein